MTTGLSPSCWFFAPRLVSRLPSLALHRLFGCSPQLLGIRTVTGRPRPAIAALPAYRPGRSAAAVLVGSAVLPDAGRYTFDLQLGENESSQAVADVFVIDANEVAVLESAFGPVLGTVCSGGAAALFGVLGGLTIWMERRTATALAAIEG